MRDKELYELVQLMDTILTNRYKDNYRKVLENEFVSSSDFQRNLELMEKRHTGDWFDFNELTRRIKVSTKKIKEFDISKHVTATSMYLHKHNYFEIDYAYRGSCNYYINNEDNVFELHENELCIVNQNIVHGIEALREEDMIFKLMIPFDYIKPEQFEDINQTSLLKKFFMHALSDDLTKASYIVFRIGDTEFTDEIMYHLFYEYVNQKMGWKQAVKNYLSELLINLMRMEECDIRVVSNIEEENFNITKVMSYISKNYQYITLKNIADDLHFHKNYLSRMIKQVSKQSFSELLCQFRLKEAENLLLSTELSITEIAARIGYNRPNFFYKIFKEHYGVTPAQFREGHGA